MPKRVDDGEEPMGTDTSSRVCCLCGGRRALRLWTVPRYGRDWTLVRCEGCGLVTLSPQPSPGDLQRYYEQTYDYGASRRERAGRQPALERDLAWIRQFKTSGRLLEIGSMHGDLLGLARQAGFTVVGLERNEQAAAEARRTWQVPVVTGCAEDFTWQADPFDVVVMSHVIEHLTDPLGVLRRLRSMMAPGGVILLKCPNIASTMARWTGRHWWWLAPPEHLFHFSGSTLQALVERAGFRQCRLATGPGDLSYLRYLPWCLIEWALPGFLRAAYRRHLDRHPEGADQRLLMGLYWRARPWIRRLHASGRGEELRLSARR